MILINSKSISSLYIQVTCVGLHVHGNKQVSNTMKLRCRTLYFILPLDPFKIYVSFLEMLYGQMEKHKFQYYKAHS